jgi:hypothetical protein
MVWLRSCDTAKSEGCNGGYTDEALSWVVQNKGQAALKDYPYKGKPPSHTVTSIIIINIILFFFFFFFFFIIIIISTIITFTPHPNHPPLYGLVLHTKLCMTSDRRACVRVPPPICSDGRFVPEEEGGGEHQQERRRPHLR